MRATIQKLNMMLRYCDAVSDDHIHFIFQPPASGLHLGDVIQLDPHTLDAPQTAANLTMGGTFTLEIGSHNVHDLRVPAIHGSSRFPSPERLDAA